MGTVYKETYTKPLPAGAKIIVRKGRRLGEWKDAKGKTRTAPLTVGKDGTERVLLTAATYTAKYRDGAGVVRKVATGCRDKTAAESALADLERQAEKVKGGILTPAEAQMIDHQAMPFGGHVQAYMASLVAAGRDDGHVRNVTRQLDRLALECSFSTLADLKRERLEAWLAMQAKTGMSARTRNAYRGAAVALCNWCVETGRLLVNPFSKIDKANEDADIRRHRRALTEDELRRLLDVARRRPLLEAMTVRRGKRKGEAYANLRPEIRLHLERIGWERALIYKTLVLTGLRKGELASITVGQLDLDGPLPYLVLRAADEKNREGSTIPLRGDLAVDLREWLAEKAKVLQDSPPVSLNRRLGVPSSPNRGDVGEFVGHVLPTSALPADAPLFNVPAGLVRILDRDLVAAGIARRVEVAPGEWKIDKRDERGRTVDVHALRHTFGTLLSKGGVAPRTAQAAMRHGNISLTMNTYTDPKLLDVAGAVDALPTLPLGAGPETEASAVSVTGTDSQVACPLVPTLVPTGGKPGILKSALDKATGEAGRIPEAGTVDVSALPVKQNNPLTTDVNGLQVVGATGASLNQYSTKSW